MHQASGIGKTKSKLIKKMLIQEFKMNPEQIMMNCFLVGAPPNDEPLFSFFEQSVGVANVDQIQHMPIYVTASCGGEGLSALADVLLQLS